MKRLGSGGFGTANLWSLFDSNTHQILRVSYVNGQHDLNLLTNEQRVVIKDTAYWSLWDRITAWSSDSRTIPREVAAHRTLSAQQPQQDTRNHDPGQRHILPYVAFRMEKPLKFYRLATDEAELGDLFGLALSFYPSRQKFRQNSANRIRRGEQIQPTDPPIQNVLHRDYEWMPIHFIWRIFGSLIEGLIFMHKHKLVHRDLKLENILLKRRGAAMDPMMGDWGIRPLLADFGATMPTAPQRYENPSDFDEVNTRRYASPEQCIGIPPFVADQANEDYGYPMDEKTDVFGCAATIWSLMTLGMNNDAAGPIWQPPKYDNWLQYLNPGITDEVSFLEERVSLNCDPGQPATDQEEGRLPDDWNVYDHWEQEREKDYSLFALMTDCLRFRPEDRPSLAMVLERIQAWLANNPDPPHVSNTHTRFTYWFEHLRR